MTKQNSKSRTSRLKWRGLKSLWRNKDGVSALEFALIAPGMVVLYFGGIELSLLMQADRRVTTVAATLGDLTSRVTAVSAEDVDDIFQSSSIVLTPLDKNIAEMRLSSLVSDVNGNVEVEWSRADNTSPRAIGSSVSDLPAGIVPPLGSVILAEVSYEYSSVIEFLPSAQGTLTDRFYLRPRRSNKVEFVGDPEAGSGGAGGGGGDGSGDGGGGGSVDEGATGGATR